MRTWLINQPIGHVGQDGKVYMDPTFHAALTRFEGILPEHPGSIADLPNYDAAASDTANLRRLRDRINEIIAYLGFHHDAHVNQGVFPAVDA